jgi:hypothetical protein
VLWLLLSDCAKDEIVTIEKEKTKIIAMNIAIDAGIMTD